ncbi:MAG: hypothetical protein H6Q30_2371 [Bacteroidetes bacterium]|nr:hypothetical protein [Bacteroidota bacterium]
MWNAGNRSPIGFAYTAAAIIVFAIWVWGAESEMTAVNGDPRSTLSGLIYGVAHNPFAQRAFVPFLTRTIHSAIPADISAAVKDRLSSIPKVQKEAGRLGWDLRYVNEYIIAFLLSFLSLLFFPFVLRTLFASLYAAEEKAIALVPLVAMFALPPFFLVGTHYIYDFPALLLFTLGFLLMIRQRWLLYYAVLAVGCVNKETMVLLLLPLLLLSRHVMPPPRIAMHAALHVLVFGLIKGTLMFVYAGNPGGAVEFHLWGNLHMLLMPYTLVTLFSIAVLGFLVWFDFKNKHPVLRKGAWLLVPFALLMIFFGTIHEARALYEVFPVYFLLISHTVLFSLLKRPYELKNAFISTTTQNERNHNGSRTYAGDPQTRLR